LHRSALFSVSSPPAFAATLCARIGAGSDGALFLQLALDVRLLFIFSLGQHVSCRFTRASGWTRGRNRNRRAFGATERDPKRGDDCGGGFTFVAFKYLQFNFAPHSWRRRCFIHRLAAAALMQPVCRTRPGAFAVAPRIPLITGFPCVWHRKQIFLTSRLGCWSRFSTVNGHAGHTSDRCRHCGIYSSAARWRLTVRRKTVLRLRRCARVRLRRYAFGRNGFGAVAFAIAAVCFVATSC